MQLRFALAAEPGNSAARPAAAGAGSSAAGPAAGASAAAAELPSAGGSRCAGRQQGLAAELPAGARCCQSFVTLLLPPLESCCQFCLLSFSCPSSPAARWSDVETMFTVRIGLGVQHGVRPQCLISNVWARARALPPGALPTAHGLQAHTSCTIGGWNRRPCRSVTYTQERRWLCQGPDTAEGRRRGRTVGVGMLSVSDRKRTG